MLSGQATDVAIAGAGAVAVKEGGQEENQEEKQYLDLIRKVLAEGSLRSDRTGTGTICIFGHQIRFSLANNRFPLLTTKRVFFRGILEELLWFIHGDTNAKHLSDKNVHIWDANATTEFLAGRGLGHREAGDLGPVYGFQWRHFGARYIDMHTDYTGQGYDQLQAAIDLIRTDPTNRRIIISAWNPADLHLMALPPCHMFCQFYVDGKKLSCQMYQRSCDIGLGMPFNIASYALLTIMVAHVCGLEPDEFIHVTGDTHVYSTHVDALKQQVERRPRPFPTLRIATPRTSMDDFCAEDFVLEGYTPCDKIAMKMAV